MSDKRHRLVVEGDDAPVAVPAITVEDTPTLIVLPSGQRYRRRMGFSAGYVEVFQRREVEVVE